MRVPAEDISYSFKIVIVGAGGVGKTCLFNRYCFNSFNMDTKMTIGINFHSNYLAIKNGAEKKYVSNFIFDFGGQERFKRLIPKFLEGANGALLVFDSVNLSSFQKLEFWHKMLIENVDPNIPKILVASKCDLMDKTAQSEIVDQNLIEKFIKEKHLDDYFTTSALKNYNVLEVFKELTNLMLKRRKVNIFVI